MEIAHSYGLQVESLLQKTGDPLSINGDVATMESCKLWETASEPDLKTGKKLAMQAASQVYEMMMAAIGSKQVLHLVHAIETLKTAELKKINSVTTWKKTNFVNKEN